MIQEKVEEKVNKCQLLLKINIKRFFVLFFLNIAKYVNVLHYSVIYFTHVSTFPSSASAT